MSTIKFGPAGIGPAKEAIDNLKEFHRLGLSACEIAFTYGVYLKDKKVSEEIGRVAEERGIFLSIHAPYYINLNSRDSKKVESSRKRILKCCEVGSWLGAKRVIFHPGFYSGMGPKETMKNIKKEIMEMMRVVKKKGWDIELCPEVMGKVNVFGSIDEIAELTRDTGCGFCIDFAHVLARYKKEKFKEIRGLFPQRRWHVHFSGIEYGEKGERNHKATDKKNWRELLEFLKGLRKEVVLICESPNPVEDSIEGLELQKKINRP